MAVGMSVSTDGAVKGDHSITIERRKRVSVTGVLDVCSFHETEIILRLDSGLMYLTGEGLHVARLLLDEGKLDVDGHVDGVVYEAPKKSVKRLFSWKAARK